MSSFLAGNKKLFFSEILIFLFIQVFGLLTGWRMFNLVNWRQTIKPPVYGLTEFLISFTAVVLLILFFLKIFKKHHLPFRLFFYLLFFLTLPIVFLVWLPELFAFCLVIVLFLLLLFKPSVLVHNLVIMMMGVGAAVFIGLGFQLNQLVIISIILAIYDVIAVFVSGHMIKMFKEMFSHGFVLALTIPRTLKGWLIKISQIQIGGEFVFLGTGDLVIPLALAVSGLRQGFLIPVFIIIGASLGWVV
jgi:presenilin-like A22 family membrane protease